MAYFIKVGDEVVKHGFLKGELKPVDTIVQGLQANLHLGLSRTINLGDYNSLKVEIGVDYPCEPETLHENYGPLSEWLVEKFIETVRSVK